MLDSLKDDLCKKIGNMNSCVIECIKEHNGYWLVSNTSDTEFRFALAGKRFIVSRVMFDYRRVGCMTECLSLIKEHLKDSNVDTICIQSVSTYPMAEWCKKNEFEPCVYNMEVKEDGNSFLMGDWLLKLHN